MHLLLLPMMIRSGWFIGMSYMAGLPPNLPGLLIAALFLGGYATWLLAKPGTWKESLPYVQASNTCNMIWMCIMALFVYMYHLSPDLHVDSPEVQRISSALQWKGVSDGALQSIEWILDGTCLVLGGVCIANIKPYIDIQVQKRKKTGSVLQAEEKDSERSLFRAAAPRKRRI
jgi:hypothetical protein